jgi:NifB/MoaA-like Fe-S oxidoreductase
VRRFDDAFRRRLRRAAARRPARESRTVTIVTGELFAPILRRLLAGTPLPGLEAEVVPAPNHFFGRAISVAGLLTGEDIAGALSGRTLGDAVLVPRVALRETAGVFLDDVSPPDLARHLGVPVETPEADADGLLDALLGPSLARRR